ncbi:hypothetical protein FMM05_00495 [Flavobacterium zepuense]|uniref:DUF6268 domain-containing protein n=1 Tax=Flavobacterium zepuense TaxID=2593302 RepID=A0A552V9M1_9FLAO|nr:DUF6268 family outer membrane beta-barrel protein [Flavobacterium zepuense]TRW27160.1 hypothetical protein FMM05_00495 [Flavobacterium zepuense]
MFNHNLFISHSPCLAKKTLDRLTALILFTSFLTLPFLANAQSQDSVAKKVIRFNADKFAEQRPFSIDFKQYGNYNFSSNLRDRDLPDGEFTNWSQSTASINLNLLQNRRWLVQINGLYRLISSESRFSTSTPNIQQNYKEDYHYHTEGLNFSYFAKLFGKTVIYTAGFALDGSEKRIERTRGVFSGIVVLKANETTTMSVGIAGTTDPGAQIPIAPIFIYQHKFNDKLTVDLTLPRYAYLRRQMSNNGRLSAGFDLDFNTTFFLYDRDAANTTYQYRQLDGNVGLVYEHILPGSITLTFKTGYRVNPTVRVLEKNSSFNDYTWEAHTDSAPYINIGVSLNPFVKHKK